MEKIEIRIIKEEDLTADQKKEIESLEKICFSDVNKEEAKEDFYDRPVARILAYLGEDFVGCALIHLKSLRYREREIVFGGPAGFCVKEKIRRKGIGNMLCKHAIEYLDKNKCDVAFLSVSDNNPAKNLYKKFGFVDLPVKYSWKKSTGEISEDNDGMLAPITNNDLFDEIIHSKETLYVGEGYW